MERGHDKPDSLVTAIECEITSVRGETHGTSFTPHSEMIMGGKSPSYSGGDVYTLTIGVKSNSPINEITFRGMPPVRAGDLIKAHIIQADEREVYDPEATRDVCPCCSDSMVRRYFLREVGEKEEAVRIDLSANEYYTAPNCPPSLKE